MLEMASALDVAGSYDRLPRHRDQTAEVSSIVVEQKGTGDSTAKSRWDNWADRRAQAVFGDREEYPVTCMRGVEVAMTKGAKATTVTRCPRNSVPSNGFGVTPATVRDSAQREEQMRGPDAS
ncbi:hypothetical protein SNOG_04548 [Parastagonospora nodorum SN15]|uniref:Uncharacterized protein n=1 Tax=Phaeosphaeria nodorum (strain SN15 / ATCC MYA-4574 / FGSC 10173) TaxID=321614 RepID=Q0UUL6_PHANO|nr:hypothetical protein SNOG_04548 [Parastagonospora nodorum SN15]EAT88308.1 hypothetical protein SNOG_04548 [Parastagonospora nodorum SN15]